MTLSEFKNKYCQDIMRAANASGFPYPYDLVEEVDGHDHYFVVNNAGEHIDVEEILFTDDTDFRKEYPTETAWQSRLDYRKDFVIHIGAAAIDPANASLKEGLEQQHEMQSQGSAYIGAVTTKELKNDIAKIDEIFGGF